MRVLISHGYDVNWGNMSIQAVTLSDTAPVSLDEKITTDEWEIDHTGGQIQSMKTLIDGEMYTIRCARTTAAGLSGSTTAARLR